MKSCQSGGMNYGTWLLEHTSSGVFVGLNLPNIKKKTMFPQIICMNANILGTREVQVGLGMFEVYVPLDNTKALLHFR